MTVWVKLIKVWRVKKHAFCKSRVLGLSELKKPGFMERPRMRRQWMFAFKHTIHSECWRCITLYQSSNQNSQHVIFAGRVFWHLLKGKARSSLDTLSTASMKALGPSTGCVGTLQHCDMKSFQPGVQAPSSFSCCPLHRAFCFQTWSLDCSRKQKLSARACHDQGCKCTLAPLGSTRMATLAKGP